MLGYRELPKANVDIPLKLVPDLLEHSYLCKSYCLMLSPLIRFVSPTMSSVSEYIEMTGFVPQIDIRRDRSGEVKR